MQKPLPFPELEEERDRSDKVKQETPVLVILGNPPYKRYPGVGMSEEQDLTLAYRATKQVELFEKKALNDHYIRFFRMAERRITEKTGQGVICFISNYSWLDGLAFAGMREHYLEAFDIIRLDNLNGDKYKTGKTTPDGTPDPSIFSTPDDQVGIQVGTAITTLVRQSDHAPAGTVGIRNLWGQNKRQELMATAESNPAELYDNFKPTLPLGLPFAQITVSDDWQHWPTLPGLFLTSFSGASTNRDSFLVDIDLDRLNLRIVDYFNGALTHEEITRRYPVIMTTMKHFNARLIRDALLKHGGPHDINFVRFVYRPFDTRWLYWEANTKLLNDKRADYKSHVFEGNISLVSQKKPRGEWSYPQVISNMGCLDLMDRGASCFPMWLRDYAFGTEFIGGFKCRPNLSDAAQSYLVRVGLGVEDLFHHVLAILHDPAYREANSGALRMEWPRIPLPGWPNGDTPGAAGRVAGIRRPRPGACRTAGL